MKDFKITVSDLSKINDPNQCVVCLWRKIKNGKLPFDNYFGGIGDTLKSLISKAINTSTSIEILNFLGNVTPHQCKTRRLGFTDPINGVHLSGDIGDVFKKPDGSYLIALIKPAKKTDAQSARSPSQEVTLNAHAFLFEKNNLGTVSELALIFFEPKNELHLGKGETTVSFVPLMQNIERKELLTQSLLKEARSLYDSISPPQKSACEDCRCLNQLIADMTAI